MTQIKVIAENRPAKSRHAVVFCCDAKYLPYAALAIHTLVRNNPVRDFDICITSLDALDMPPALEGHDVRICQIDVGVAFEGFPITERFSAAAYLRLTIPEAFSSDYQKILYLDCDVFVVGEVFGDVFGLDLRNRPVGACTDCLKLKYPKKPTNDQKLLGINGPYFNSGVLLIDVLAFREQRIFDRCVEAFNEFGPEKIYFDQTLLNLALSDNWAELHPAWNWQWAIVRSFFEMMIDVQVLHFVSAAKPWTDFKGSLPIRYRELARRFFQEHYPDLAVSICPPAKQLQKKRVVLSLIKHITRSFAFVDGYNRHGGDITVVRLPNQS